MSNQKGMPMLIITDMINNWLRFCCTYLFLFEFRTSTLSRGVNTR